MQIRLPTHSEKKKKRNKKNVGLYTVKSNTEDKIKKTTFLHTAVKWCNDLPKPKRHSIGKFVFYFLMKIYIEI